MVPQSACQLTLPPQRMDDAMKILAYEQALKSIQMVVTQRRWEDLEVKTEMFIEAKNQLQHDLVSGDMDEELKHRLEQLSIKHRRVMRQLSEQVRRTEDDLNQVNQGLRHLHYVQEVCLQGT